MSFVGSLNAPSPEFLALLTSTAPAQSHGTPSPKLTERKPDRIGPAPDDDGINPIVALAAYEYFTSGDST